MKMTRNMSRRPGTARAVGTLALLACVLIASGCGGDPGPEESPGSDPTPTAASPGGPGTDPEIADGLYFYPPVEGATLTVTESGAQEGGSEVTVETVGSDADGQTVTVLEVVSSGDSVVDLDRSFRTGPDGSLSIDVGGFLATAEGLTVTASGDDVHIPPIADLEAGDTASGETFVELGGEGITVRNDVSYEVSGEGYEPVTVPAGSYDQAYLVTLELTVDSSLGANVTGTIRYWFVPGFARVRQESTIESATFVEELATSSVTPP